ncbi:hypothetical protein MMC22_003159 [Lobaria immixta]|nr:hypothetical protein [Lobaria immixta]
MKFSSILTMPLLLGSTALAFNCDGPGVFLEFNKIRQDPPVEDFNASPDVTVSFLCSDNIESVTLSLYLAAPDPNQPGGISVREGTQVNPVFPTNVNFLSAFSADYPWTNFAGKS